MDISMTHDGVYAAKFIQQYWKVIKIVMPCVYEKKRFTKNCSSNRSQRLLVEGTVNEEIKDALDTIPKGCQYTSREITASNNEKRRNSSICQIVSNC